MAKRSKEKQLSTKKREATDFIVVHCTATPPDMDIGADDIDRWHKERGWLGIGYHSVIRRDGTVEDGRDIDTMGAHVRGFNATSVGIALVGTEDFTGAQFSSLRNLINDILELYPTAKILGHRDFSGVKKICPGFDVQKWWVKQQEG